MFEEMRERHTVVERETRQTHVAARQSAGCITVHKSASSSRAHLYLLEYMEVLLNTMPHHFIIASVPHDYHYHFH